MKTCTEPDWREELKAIDDGFQIIAGIDEAGRGALAGPVVAACVVLPMNALLPGVNDSKTLSAIDRDRLYELIVGRAISYGVGIVPSDEIDRINILRATHVAMRLALQNLSPAISPEIALIDGLAVHPFPIPHTALVKGDGRSISIASASIIAKVTRDRIMRDFDLQFPGYGFASNKGYGAKTHLSALDSLGVCDIHRKTYRPVAIALSRAKGELHTSRQSESLELSFEVDAFEVDAMKTESNSQNEIFAALSSSNTKEVGKEGERQAKQYLERLGWKALVVNYRCSSGEMDLIAEEITETTKTLVFVEVKTRRSAKHGSPLEAVDAKKRARLVAIALHYLGERSSGGEEPAMRFDVVEVFVKPNRLSQITLHRGVFGG